MNSWQSKWNQRRFQTRILKNNKRNRNNPGGMISWQPRVLSRQVELVRRVSVELWFLYPGDTLESPGEL